MLSLWANAGLRGIAFNSETAHIQNDQYNYLRQKCEHLITIYDNDDTGKKMSRKIYESYAIPFIDISEFTDHKDLADYFMEGGGYLPIHERIFKINKNK